MVVQAANRFVALSLDVLPETLNKRFLIIRQHSKILRHTVVHVFDKRLCAPGCEYEIVHLVLVAALKNIYILCRSVRVSLVGVQGQILPVFFRSYAHISESIQCRKHLLDVHLLKISYGLAAEKASF